LTCLVRVSMYIYLYLVTTASMYIYLYLVTAARRESALGLLELLGLLG
jgi:hypothetical protein